MPSSKWEIKMEAGAQEASELANPCLSRGLVSAMRTIPSANVLCSPSVDSFLWSVRSTVKKRSCFPRGTHRQMPARYVGRGGLTGP